MAGSFLDGAPVLRVSARTGAGLDELRAALLCAGARGARAPGARACCGCRSTASSRCKGFGTVVTGTLVAGSLDVGEELEVLPSGQRARVRGLQVHGEAAPHAWTPERARRVNLAGVETSDLARGDVLVRPGTLRATSMLDVELSLLAGRQAARGRALACASTSRARRCSRACACSSPARSRRAAARSRSCGSRRKP